MSSELVSVEELILDYLRRWPQEANTANAFLNFIRDERQPFHRETLVGHITSSAWIVDPSGQNVLLTHHKKLNMWIQLGGHADGDSDLLSVALREAQEESGIKRFETVSRSIFDLDIHPIGVHKDVAAHLHYDVRFALKALDTATTISDESHDLHWVSLDEIEKYTAESSMLRMSAKWRVLQDSFQS